jgi:AcrR family transcriptional regulator
VVSAPQPWAEDAPAPNAPSRRGRTARGERTRVKLLLAAEDVFAELGYHEGSIVKITDAAGVAQGTFYLYFSSKLQIFEELVDDLNQRVRHAMSEGSAAGGTRIESERLGFAAFFRFTAEHPALYRIIRQAEFVSPAALRRHYDRIVDGYTEGLTAAAAAEQIAPDVDPVVAAWALMGIGELVGMRWVLWDDATEIPPPVFDEVMRLVQRALGARDVPGGLR